jgi:Glycosyl hydrolase family 26
MRRLLALSLAVSALAFACGSGTAAAPRHTLPQPAADAISAPSARAGTSKHLLHPAKKYFGISGPGVPQDVAALRAIKTQVGKEPDLAAYYMDWTHQFDVGAAQRMCAEGVVPMMTWESWSWEDNVDGVTTRSQPAYAPRKIAAGAYDSYVRATAKLVKSLHCTLFLRFDHEMNGTWYPWGLGTVGMHNRPAAYVAMWRHVWKIFRRQGVHNVIWVWSPNLLYPGGVDRLGQMYPGNAYVDIVGLDGYLRGPKATISSAFGGILTKLASVAPQKPWLVAETGVSGGAKQPAGLKALLHMVATNKRLIGLVYFDQDGPRADWRFTTTRKSLKAFKIGLSAPVYGHAPLANP